MATRSARSLSSAARFGNTPGYSTGSSFASSGRSTYWRKSLSRSGAVRFHSSLRSIGTTTSLKSGLPSRETWTYGPTETALPSSRSVALRRDAGRPDADRGVGRQRVGRRLAVGGQPRDRDLDRERVHVERAQRVHARRRRRRDQVQVLERSQRGEVEDRAEVDVEAVEALPGEDLDAVAEVVDRRVGRAPRSSASSGCRRCTAVTAGRRRSAGADRCGPRARRGTGGGSSSGCRCGRSVPCCRGTSSGSCCGSRT